MTRTSCTALPMWVPSTLDCRTEHAQHSCKPPCAHRVLCKKIEFYVNDGTDTIILPGSHAGLPLMWDVVPFDLHSGLFFVLYWDLIHAV